MVIWLYQYLTGYLTIEITGQSQERFINMCMHHKIKIWNLIPSDNHFRFNISLRNLSNLNPIAKKTDIKIQIVERIGLPFHLQRYRKRTLFGSGIMIFLVASFLLSQFIWLIDISGNQLYTDEAIIAILNENDIQITMSIQNINCDDIVTLLRAEFEYITWVSAHIDGCKLMVTVKENDQLDGEVLKDSLSALDTSDLSENIAASNVADTSKDDTEEDGNTMGIDIIAQESGTIASLITRAGTPLVHIGDYVEAGDVLISGCLELYNDSGEIIGYQYVTSEAEIEINTAYTYSETIPLSYQAKLYSEQYTEKEFIRIGNYYLIAIKLNQLEYPYDIVITETSLMSEQQNSWFLSIGKQIYQEYQWVDSIYTDIEVQEILSTSFGVYCDELNEKGVEIIENNVNIYIDDKSATASGTLDVMVKNTATAMTEVRELPQEVAQEGITE